MDVVKAFACLFSLLFQPILIADLVYSVVALACLIGCLLVSEFFAFFKISARIAIPQALFLAAGPDLASRHSTIMKASLAARIGKPIQSFHEVPEFKVFCYIMYPLSILVGLDKPLQLFCHTGNSRTHPTMTATNSTVTYCYTQLAQSLNSLTSLLSVLDKIGFRLGQRTRRHSHPNIVSLAVPRN